jgi:hypothetical protein
VTGIRLLLVVAVAVGLVGIVETLWASVTRSPSSRVPADPWRSVLSEDTDHLDPYLLAFAAGTMPGR